MKSSTANAILLFSALAAAAPVEVSPASGAASFSLGELPTGVFPSLASESGTSGLAAIESLLSGLKPKTGTGLAALISGAKAAKASAAAAASAPAAINSPLTSAPSASNSTSSASSSGGSNGTLSAAVEKRLEPSRTLEERAGIADLLAGLTSSTAAATSAAATETGTTTGAASGIAALISADSSGTGASSASSSGVVSVSSTLSGCKAATLVYARGTGEPGGTMGLIVGPQFSAALSTDLDGDYQAQGVAYSANIAGDIDLGASGAPYMASTLKTVLASCPDTKIILGGYSQGALVIHNALSTGKIDGSTITAIVAFGDPFNGQDFKGVDSSKVVRYCGKTDGICDHNGVTNAAGAHLAYSKSAAAAASQIAVIVKAAEAA